MKQIKAIYANQIGYFCEDKKYGYVSFDTSDSKSENSEADGTFCLKTIDGNVVYNGNLSAPVYDKMADETISCADFSDFKSEGKFVLCAGGKESFPFALNNKVYDDLYYSILHYYTLSRCGCEVQDSVFGHKPCHTKPAVVYGTKEKKHVLGGWHDAGDYGRYIVASAKTVMDLLFAYEAAGDFSRFDILDEVRFELDWMLQMQREDGAVYHKISCYNFCAFIVPEEETKTIVLAPVSTTATADFAGCLAYASKFYENRDKDFAEKLLSAAKKAQDYLDCHDDEIYENPPKITTGCYGDINVKDERYFALCGLFAATKDKKYLEKAKSEREKGKIFEPANKPFWFKTGWNEGFGWGIVSGYGSEILLKNADLVQDEELLNEIKSAFTEQAEELTKDSENEIFGYCFDRTMWGSNGAICDSAHTLFVASDISGNKKYREIAKKQLDYILGCNPMNICYVTGNGTNSVKFPHHRQSGALGSAMPGMLSGGPASGMHDSEAKKYLKDKPPLKSFLDLTGSYSTNEVAIYWNSALVHLVARLQSK